MPKRTPESRTEDALLAQRLAERVKTLRSRRGMSRKVLSEASGVSERYLAQLEAGQANVTLQVLSCLAQAMNTSMTALIAEQREESAALAAAKALLERLSPADQEVADLLLRQRFRADRAAVGRVSLIGLRGAGKTTLGRRLAEHCRVPFVRITHMVERLAGLDLPELFMSLGQKGYRRLEYNALQSTLQQFPHVVIETGGSLVSEPATFELLLESCFTVWLRASPQEHMQRVYAQGDVRPMAGHRQAMEDLNAMLEFRRSLYGRADAVIDTSYRSVEDCADELIGLAEPFLGKALAAAP